MSEIPISGCLTVSNPAFETVRQDYWTYGQASNVAQVFRPEAFELLWLFVC